MFFFFRTFAVATLALTLLWTSACNQKVSPVATAGVTCVPRAGAGSSQLCFEEADGRAIVEGDIVIGMKDDILKQAHSRMGVAFAMGSKYRWPNRTIPYVINSALQGTAAPGVITQAINEYHSKTNFRIVPRTTEADYVEFTTWAIGGCYSGIGRAGGHQEIATSCLTVSGLVHELGHCWGLLHEQTRHDRDQYLIMHWENIFAPQQFISAGFGEVDIGPFNPHSIMMYAVAPNTPKPFFTYKDGTADFGGTTLNSGDIDALNTIYSMTDPPSFSAYPAPQNIVRQWPIQVISPTELQINLVDEANGESATKLYYATSLNGPWTAISRPGTPGAGESWQPHVTGLVPGADYYFRAQTVGAPPLNQLSDFSRTLRGNTQATAPAAATALYGDEIGETSVHLHWTNHLSDPYTIEVWVAFAGTGDWHLYDPANPGSGYSTDYLLAAGTSDFIAAGLNYARNYDLKIRTVDAQGNYADSNVYRLNGSDLAPIAPQISICSSTTTTISCTWHDNSLNETGFRVERGPSLTGPFTALATLPANTTQYTDTGLPPATGYYYRIVAFTSTRESAGTPVYFATLALPPATPTGFVVRGTTASSITLAWNLVTPNVSHYHLEFAYSPTGTFTTIGGDIPGSQSTYTDPGLSAGMTRYYRLSAYNATVGSGYTSVISGTTTSATPTPAPAPSVSIAANGTAYNAGGTLTFRISGGNANDPQQWVSLTMQGSWPTQYIAWGYYPVANATNLSLAIPTTAVPGMYVLRLFAQNGFTILAESSAFSIGGGTITADRWIRKSSDNPLQYTFSGGDSTDYQQGVALAVSGSPNSSYVSYHTHIGSAGQGSFTIPPAGAYVFRLLAHNGATLLAESAPFSIGGAVVAANIWLTSPQPVYVGTIGYAFSGANAADAGQWVTVAPEGSPLSTYGEWRYAQASSGSGTFHVYASGRYVLRIFAASGYLLVAQSPGFTVY